MFTQISKLKSFKYQASEERIKTALKSFTFQYLDIDEKQTWQDKKRLKIIRRLHEQVVILKPDKGQGIVLISRTDYFKSMETMFGDKTKFKVVNEDPTITRVNTIQTYVNRIFKRNEITEEEKKQMRPTGGNRARARGLPKIHKDYDSLPKFRPIIDTIGTPYHGIGKFLKNLLNPLTQNEYTVKDSFEAVNKIRNIPPELFEQGYSYVSFDVESLFTSVPLKRTVNIILDRIYKEKLVDTKLRKSTLKKLILDTCQKTTFSFHGKLYEQVDGVSMGSSLGPVSANVIMTELEKAVVKKLIDEGTIKFYIRYVDDTLLLVKNEDVQRVLACFNSFDKNLKFTVDEFESKVHFLDIAIDKNETDVFYKKTNTGQYTHYSSYTPWNLKVSWVSALFVRAKRICCNDTLFQSQLIYIKKLMSWNGFPKYTCNKIIKNLIDKYKNDTTRNVVEDDENVSKVFVRLPYCGAIGERLIRKCISRITRQLSAKVQFKVFYKTSKISDFVSVKDPIPLGQKNDVIYQIQCPGCLGFYIGKTSCCVEKRMHEHAEKEEQPMFQHLEECEAFQQWIGFMNLGGIDSNEDPVIQKNFYRPAVMENYKVLKTVHNSALLALSETYFVRKLKPKINDGLKSCVDFRVFDF